MATTFDVIYLGVLADMDTTEGDQDAEGAGNLVGLTLGSSGDPLFDHIQSFSPGSTGYSADDATAYDPDTSGDTFSIDGGPDQTFDMGMIYTATITYADGSTATANVMLAQDTDGNTYLAPQSSYNANQAALEAGPIESITLGSTVTTGIEGYGLLGDRYDGSFSGPVDGTAGDDVMGSGFTDVDGDAIDGADGDRDVIVAGAGNDTINGGAGGDTIDAGADDDTIIIDGGLTDVGETTSVDGGDGIDMLILDPTDDRNLNVDMNTGTVSDGVGGAEVFSNIENITTAGGDDTITGDTGNNVIDAGAGDDTIEGGADDDSIDGGTGNDLIYGDRSEVFAAGNRLTNGDFSNGLSDWTVNNVAGTAPAVYSDGRVSFNNNDETQYGDSIQQSFDANVGQEYTVTLDLFEDDGGNGDHTFQFDILDENGNVVETVTQTVTNGTTLPVSFTFTPTTSTNSIRITNTNTTNSTASDGQVDNVVIEATGPLPAAGNDSLTGGAGTDTIDGGAGDDRLDGGTGNDTVIGGLGDDTLIAGLGSDTLDGGDGDDLLIRDGADVNDILNELNGGAGNDTIRVEGGVNANDQIDGGDGIDTFELLPGDNRDFTIDMVAGDASDGLTGTQEFVNIENITAGGGNDTIIGDSGANVLQGGVGDDSIAGGSGDDTLIGGTGADTIDGGAGSDVLTGGDGADVFIADGTADTITDFDTTTGIDGGGSGDNDFVDLSAYYNQANLDAWNLANPGQTYSNPIGWMRADQADNGVLDQAGGLEIQANGAPAASNELNAENTGVVCYVAGTQILTPKGEVAIETLSIGDEVITRDNGAQEIRWIGMTSVDCTEKLAPIHIRAGALGDGCPHRDLFVSPQHRMLVRSKIVERMTGNREALVAATRLQSMAGIRKSERSEPIRYIHLMCDAHEVVFAEGAPSETLFPGPQARKAMGPDAWAELVAIFPEITETASSYPPVGQIPSNAKQKNLVRRHQCNGMALLEIE